MYHLVGLENGINKRHILDTRPNNLSGWRARPLFHSSISPCFPTLLTFILANSCPSFALCFEGQSCFGVGEEWEVRPLSPWETLQGNGVHADHEFSAVFSWICIQYLLESQCLPPSFCWVQPYSFADPVEISGPSCGVRSCCVVCVTLVWWEPWRWTYKPYL